MSLALERIMLTAFNWVVLKSCHKIFNFVNFENGVPIFEVASCIYCRTICQYLYSLGRMNLAISGLMQKEYNVVILVKVVKNVTLW